MNRLFYTLPFSAMVFVMSCAANPNAPESAQEGAERGANSPYAPDALAAPIAVSAEDHTEALATHLQQL